MKKLAFLLLAFASLTIKAQTTYPEPDFDKIPVWYDAVSKTDKNFERLPGNRGARVSGMTSSEALIFFAGETAAIQFPADKIPPFIFKMPTTSEDPASVLEIVQLQVNKHKHQREFIAGKAGMTGNKTTIETIALDFKKLGNGAYQAIPVQPLQPGEYGFSVGKQGFLFSIQGN